MPPMNDVHVPACVIRPSLSRRNAVCGVSAERSDWLSTFTAVCGRLYVARTSGSVMLKSSVWISTLMPARPTLSRRSCAVGSGA